MPQIGFIATMIIDYVGPFYVKLFQLSFRAYCELPVDLLSALAGLGLSFCGGAYCASISAIQAFKMCGWERTKAALIDIYNDGCAIYEAYVADDAKDDDGDGIRDVTRLSANDLLTRKLAVMAMAVKDPDKLNAAVGGLYTSWLAVQAVLRTEFAKTITLGVSIAAMATPYLQKVGVPVLVHVMPPAYHAWIPLIIANTARSIGVGIAWKMQEVVSAVHLALLGGLLFSRSLMRWARTKGYLATSPEETVLDEVVGYAVAAVGFWCQITCGFFSARRRYSLLLTYLSPPPVPTGGASRCPSRSTCSSSRSDGSSGTSGGPSPQTARRREARRRGRVLGAVPPRWRGGAEFRRACGACCGGVDWLWLCA